MFGFRFLKAQPTQYVILYRNGQPRREGAGLAFWYFRPTSAIVVVPTASVNEPFIFEEVTSDFQDVTVQGQVTYRIGEPKRIASLLDFSLEASGKYASEDPQKLSQRLINEVQVAMRSEIQGLSLEEALAAGEALLAQVSEKLARHPTVEALGVEILGLSVLAIRPKPETARALEAEAREALLRRADEAIYSRRNAAVEQERAIKENELATEVAVENKKRQVREAQMDAERSVQERRLHMRQEEMAGKIGLETQNKELVTLSSVNAREEADAKAYGITATMRAFAGADAKVLQALASVGMDPGQLLALAFRDIADNAAKIGELNVSPELLREMLPAQGEDVSRDEASDRKIVLIVRETRLDELISRFNTVQQAQFYVEHLGADFSDYKLEHNGYRAAVSVAEAVLRGFGRVQRLERRYLSNFIFGPDDLVVVLGQDGLVANTLKYLNGQHVIGLNPDPKRWDGVLLPFAVADLRKIVPEEIKGRRPLKTVTMAKASLNTGISLFAVNDLFIGPRSHVSARYALSIGGRTERQSSSGIIVSTGLGSTGWLKSIYAGFTATAASLGEGPSKGAADGAFPWDAARLHYAVREPFPSRTTGASLVFGWIDATGAMEIVSEMPEQGVIFSDGIEADFLEFNSGTKATIGIAERRGMLVA